MPSNVPVGSVHTPLDAGEPIANEWWKYSDNVSFWYCNVFQIYYCPGMRMLREDDFK